MAVLDQARARGPGGQGQGRQKGGQGISEPGAALRGVGLCGDSCLGQGTEQEARALVTDGIVLHLFAAFSVLPGFCDGL